MFQKGHQHDSESDIKTYLFLGKTPLRKVIEGKGMIWMRLWYQLQSFAKLVGGFSQVIELACFLKECGKAMGEIIE
jgi:hypothetical protein